MLVLGLCFVPKELEEVGFIPKYHRTHMHG